MDGISSCSTRQSACSSTTAAWGQWSDLGRHQTILLLCRAFGLHGCAGEALPRGGFPRPPPTTYCCGIALGFGDGAQPKRRARAGRRSPPFGFAIRLCQS
jgi:hypothetical protein